MVIDFFSSFTLGTRDIRLIRRMVSSRERFPEQSMLLLQIVFDLSDLVLPNLAPEKFVLKILWRIWKVLIFLVRRS